MKVQAIAGNRGRCGLADRLGERIIGQRCATDVIAERIGHGELGLARPGKPAGTFLLLGPTGVGKTESVKAVADELGTTLARWDLSEFRSSLAVDLFLGRHAGEEGRFAREMRRQRNPRVLLFDEFEKAHPELHDLFLQMTDEGRITTADGEVHDLSGRYIFLTSNLGALAAARMRASSPEAVAATVTGYARRTLRPELFARLDEVIVFHRLALSDQQSVCERAIGSWLDRLRERQIFLTAGADVGRFLLAEGFTEDQGARPVQRTVERHLNRAIAPFLPAATVLRGELRANAACTAIEFVPKP